MIDKKLFTFEIREHNGEQQYSHTEYVWAKDLKQAEKLARKYSKNFYEGGFSGSKDQWSVEYSYTMLYWELGCVREISEISIDPINGNKLVVSLCNCIEEV